MRAKRAPKQVQKSGGAGQTKLCFVFSKNYVQSFSVRVSLNSVSAQVISENANYRKNLLVYWLDIKDLEKLYSTGQQNCQMKLVRIRAKESSPLTHKLLEHHRKILQAILKPKTNTIMFSSCHRSNNVKTSKNGS